MWIVFIVELQQTSSSCPASLLNADPQELPGCRISTTSNGGTALSGKQRSRGYNKAGFWLITIQILALLDCIALAIIAFSWRPTRICTVLYIQYNIEYSNMYSITDTGLYIILYTYITLICVQYACHHHDVGLCDIGK